jgi:hypothetical protein
VKVLPVINHSGHLRGQPQRGTFDEASSQAHRPGIDLVLSLREGQRTSGWLILCIGYGWAKRYDNRRRQRKRGQQAPYGSRHH